ncbi:MAG: META domain-containing protein [Spirochaetaceae bacterium]|jgi:heat shock protein HslJ|nr:META domain-containing protein [Spirochaetaceae bacterium]
MINSNYLFSANSFTSHGALYCPRLTGTAIRFLICAACFFMTGIALVPAQETAQDADITGIDWYLYEVKRGKDSFILDRAAPGSAAIYSFRVEKGRVSGKGAPNNWSADITLGNGTLKLGLIASTKMFSFAEPEQLKEHEYLTGLERAARWKLNSSGALELTLSGKPETVFVFTKLNVPPPPAGTIQRRP